METRTFLGWSAALCLGASLLQAQETNSVQQLQQQLKQLQEDFEKAQQEQRRRIEALQQQIEALRMAQPQAATSAPPLAPSAAAPVAPAEPKPPWSPTAPITLFGGQRNYVNLSFDALFSAGASTADDIGSLQLGGHDPVQRGFTAQNLETVFIGNVDPFLRGQVSLVGHICADGDFHFEAEEAYLESLGLPWNLQLRAGQFLTEFGRNNPTHPHTWNFVDAPLVNGRLMGAEGLRNPGARLSWLAPTPFYSELLFTVQDSLGGTAHSFRGAGGGGHHHDGEEHPSLFGRELIDRRTKTLGDMLYVGRYAASFDLSDTQTLLAGASAATGPNNSGPDTTTQIYGLDLFWKWKPLAHHGGFPFVSWQTEAMMRRYQAGAFAEDVDGDGVLDIDLPRETLWDYGLYSEVAWGVKKGWVAAFRGDYVFPAKRAAYESILGPDADRASRWRISPNLTYYPSEFSKIRLQYNFDHRNGLGDDHSVWLQFEFLLGTHAAHKF